jgi:NADH:ubiquinone oxidoreductase subunit 3 (subunit A)
MLLSLIFAFINYIFSFLLYFLKSDANKSAYECGFEPFDESMRHPFDIHFYIVGILFLVFDLEISCLVPAVFNVGNNNYETVFIIAVFLSIVTVGFVLEYNIGALDWFLLKIKQVPVNILYFMPISLGYSNDFLITYIIVPEYQTYQQT